jgi:Reverse transcriptase (RNA-dependent DNA polymerase)
VHADTISDPCTYKEAMSRPDAAKWELACSAEICAFKDMGTFEIVLRPEDRKVVGSKWVFKIKRGPDGKVIKYKSRIVAQGFTQIEGLDYDETFAPVAKFASICAIMALATEHDLEIHQMDVKSAYLNSELKEKIYMGPPLGLDVPDSMVLKLLKAVYGTKQGGRVWYESICAKLEDMGYRRTKADHAVFVCVRKGGMLSIIALYVDDIMMVSNNLDAIHEDKEALKRAYQMSDLGEISWILRMHVTCD